MEILHIQNLLLLLANDALSYFRLQNIARQVHDKFVSYCCTPATNQCLKDEFRL